MYKIIHISIFLFFALMGLYLSAEQTNVENNNEIKGAFGFNLGEDVSCTKLSNTGFIRCKIPFRNFLSCHLYVTGDKKIFGIKSEVEYDTADEAMQEFKIVLDLLQKKYNSQFVDVTPGSRIGVVAAYLFQNSDNRYILLQQEKRSVIITYLDRELRAQNQKRIKEQTLDKNKKSNTP